MTDTSAAEPPSRRGWLVLTVAGMALYLTFTAAYFLLGDPNADEGWYLYASRLVYEGRVPYQDFAYTQTPLFPYVYGIPQRLVGSGIYVGRATAAAFSILMFLLSVHVARKHAGPVGGAVASLLLGTFTYGIYFNTIVKTYSLASFLIVLAFLLFSRKARTPLWYSLAIALCVGAMMVRLSALFFAITMVCYCIITERRRTRSAAIVLTFFGLTALAGWYFLFPNTQAARWGLLTHHTSHWVELSLSQQVQQVLWFRIPALARFYMPYVVLLVSLGYFGLRSDEMRAFLQRNPLIVAVTLGLALFGLSHLAAGRFQLEYYVPVLVCLFPVIGIFFARAYEHAGVGRGGRMILEGVLGTCVVVALMTYKLEHLEVPTRGRKLPVERIQSLADFVSQNTQPEDKILALEALWVAVETGRYVPPGLEMAQFSYWEGHTDLAEALHLVNCEMVVRLIKSPEVSAVLLTKDDWRLFKEHGSAEVIREALSQRFRLAYTERSVGHHHTDVHVYLPR